MNAGRSAYLAKETTISVVINMVLSAAFFIALFHGRTPVQWWGVDRLAFDFLPQTFMVALMGALVPGLLTRQRLRSGKLAIAVDSIPSSGAVIRRALLIASASAVVIGGGAMGLTALLGPSDIAFTTGLILKILFGGVVAVIATPLAIRKTLGVAHLSPKGAAA